MQIATLTVYNTNGKNGRADRVTVLRDGQVLGRIEMRKHNPLGYLRRWPNSQHTHDMIKQLRAAGVPEDEISQLLAKPEAVPRKPEPLNVRAIPRDMLAQAWFSIRA